LKAERDGKDTLRRQAEDRFKENDAPLPASAPFDPT
jgi:hypothetical protein